MLERIESIVKVGLFEDYSHSPGLDFGGVTLIYGENGVGKSTIAAILDSLRERNGAEIIRRRSLPGNVTPTAAISLGGKVFRFNGHDWDDQPPYDTLEVFYPGFVNRNVHASTAIESDHRRNLCELILGRKAIEKMSRLAKADDEARSALAEKKAIEKELLLLIKKPDSLDTFLGLPNDMKIEEHLSSLRAELKQAQSREVILTRGLPNKIALPAIHTDALTALLEKSTQGIDAGIADVIQKHIHEHLDSNGEKWLLYGAKHIGTDNKCPFCRQDVSGSSLATAVRSYFSAEYRAYIELLSVEIKAILDQLCQAAFSALQVALSTQVTVASQWVEAMPIDQGAIEAALAEAETIWGSAAANLAEMLEMKQANPLESMGVGLAEEAMARFEPAMVLLRRVNDILSECRQKARDHQAALSKANILEIEQRLQRLENQKARFEPLAQKLLEKRNALIEKRTKMEEEKAELKKAIDEHALRVVGKYQSGINHYLDSFGCDIRIEAIEPRFPSGKASVQYTLKAHGHEIDLGLSEGDTCFETVLSEGDKYALALAFFLARLKDIESLTGRTIVLDDPVNSFGSFRRILIAGAVRDLRVREAQVVVLTHDKRLAAMIWRDKKLKVIVPLQIERSNSGSHIMPWDVDLATQSEYVKNYLALHDFLESGGDHGETAACIRPYVEQRLRHLYPGPPLETRDSLGRMIGKIRDSNPGSRLDGLRIKLPELEAINDASLPSHHATDDVPGMLPLTPEGVRIFAQKALTI